MIRKECLMFWKGFDEDSCFKGSLILNFLISRLSTHTNSHKY